MKRVFIIITALFITAGTCYAAEDAKQQVKKGNVLYGKGRFKESLEHYKKASLQKPNSSIVNYDLGAASYKLKDYQKAVDFFNQAIINDKEETICRQASYNLANSEYKLGISREDSDLRGAISLLTESLRHYEKALELDKEDKDAIYNHRYVKKELERLKEKLKQERKQQEHKAQENQKQEERQQEKHEQKQQEQGNKQQGQKEQEGQEKREPGDRRPQGRRDKDRKEQEEQEQKQQKQEKEEHKDTSTQGTSRKEQKAEELSAKQASLLVDNYHHEEEPKGLYKQRIDTSGMAEVDKDW